MAVHEAAPALPPPESGALAGRLPLAGGWLPRLGQMARLLYFFGKIVLL